MSSGQVLAGVQRFNASSQPTRGLLVQVPERFEFALDGRTIRMEDGQISVSGESDHTGLLQTLQSLGGALQSAIQSITSLVGGKK